MNIPECNMCKNKIDGVKRKFYAIGPLKYNGEWSTMCYKCHNLFGQFEKTTLFYISKLKEYLGIMTDKIIYMRCKVSERNWKKKQH